MDRAELLTEFILQSDRIERIHDDRSLLEEQILTIKADGHVGAFLFLEKLADEKDRLLTEKDIKRVQGLITAEQGDKDPNLRLEPRHIGEYRDVAVSIFGRECVLPDQIDCRMSSLTDKIRNFQKNFVKIPEMNAVAEIADFYFEFENIHPFRDGNGRTGRAIVFYLMKYSGREPFIFREEDMYLHHFSSLQSGNLNVMRRYFWEKCGLMP